MKDFLIQYWRVTLYVVCALVSVVFFIVKKKPVKVVDTVRESIVRLLPYCINQAEKLEGASGADKKAFALSMLFSLLSNIVKVSGDVLKENYSDFAAEQVEVILTTPQKKAR